MENITDPQIVAAITENLTDPQIVATIIVGAISLVSLTLTVVTRRSFAHLQIDLEKKARLEASRSKGYAKIWNSTASLNLFGSETEVDVQTLTDILKKWYFNHGWVLTGDAKKKYFLIQEALNFSDVNEKKVSVERPSRKSLYGGPESPTKRLQAIRKELLGIESIGENASYEIGQL